MLTRSESHEMLVKYGRGALWTKHCEAVAEAAARVGQALGERRVIDQGFLWSAALLHDIGRCVTHDPILHGVEGYRLLMELHQPEEAFVCASHILFGLDSVQAARFGLPAQDFVPQTIEARLVALVDFLLEGERPTTLSQRFVGLRNRNAGNDFFLSQLDEAYEKARSGPRPNFLDHQEGVINGKEGSKPLRSSRRKVATHFMLLLQSSAGRVGNA